MSPQPGPDDHQRPQGEEDPGADTAMWQRFASDAEEPARPKAVGAPFRILTLLAGLVVFAILVYLLLL